MQLKFAFFTNILMLTNQKYNTKIVNSYLNLKEILQSWAKDIFCSAIVYTTDWRNGMTKRKSFIIIIILGRLLAT